MILDRPPLTRHVYPFDQPEGRAPEQARLKRQSSLLDPLSERVGGGGDRARDAASGGIATLPPMIGVSHRTLNRNRRTDP